MNILFLSHIWPPAIDGGSQIVYQSQKHLKKLGHQTLTITTNCNSTDDFINSKSYNLNLKSSRVIRLPVYKTKLFVYLKKITSKFLKIARTEQGRSVNCKLLNLLRIGPIFKPISFLKALIKVRQFKPDLIIAGPLPTTINLYAYFLAKITKSKLVIIPCFHHQDPAFKNKILLNILKKADLIWTLSSYEKNYLQKKLNINSHKFFTSYPGLNLIPLKKAPTKDSTTTNLLFLGNFAAHKKIDLLIKAFSKIYQKFPNTTLTIAGQKTLYFPQIEKELNKLSKKTRSNIKIYAQKYNSIELKKFLDNSHIFINPSIHESFGIVFMEALSRGVPIIGSNIPTVKNLIKKTQAGLVFEKNNQDDLVSKITTLIENKKLYKQYSQNGLKFTKDLKWPKIINSLNTKIVQI